MGKRLVEILEAHCERCPYKTSALTIAAAVDSLVDHFLYAHDAVVKLTPVEEPTQEQASA